MVEPAVVVRAHRQVMTSPSSPPPTQDETDSLSKWIAYTEIAAGTALGLGGCAMSLRTDASMAGVGAAFALGFSFVALVVPGLALLSGHRYRWLGQVLLVLALAWVLLGNTLAS